MSDLKDPRVLFAAERTLLAWNRTSIALIAFGFVIERSAMLIKLVSGTDVKPHSLAVTAGVGVLFMIGGAFVAVYSTRQYVRVLGTLNPAEFPAGYSARWGVVVNAIVAILGLLLSLSLLLGY